MFLLLSTINLCISFLFYDVYMKAVFWLVIMVLTQISRSGFKHSRISMLIQHIYVLGRFVNFWVIFRYIWRINKIHGNRNFEDLVLF